MKYLEKHGEITLLCRQDSFPTHHFSRLCPKMPAMHLVPLSLPSLTAGPRARCCQAQGFIPFVAPDLPERRVLGIYPVATAELGAWHYSAPDPEGLKIGFFATLLSLGGRCLSSCSQGLCWKLVLVLIQPVFRRGSSAKQKCNLKG